MAISSGVCFVCSGITGTNMLSKWGYLHKVLAFSLNCTGAEFIFSLYTHINYYIWYQIVVLPIMVIFHIFSINTLSMITH